MGRQVAESRDEFREVRVARLMPHHRGMARAMLAGATNSDLALRFGVSQAWVSTIVNSPLFKAELARLEHLCEDALIDSEMIGLQPRAMEVIAEQLFDEKASKSRTDTAFKLLDRTGYHPKNEQGGDSSTTYNILNFAPMPGESPAEAKDRLRGIREAMQAEGNSEAINAEFADEIGGEPKAPVHGGSVLGGDSASRMNENQSKLLEHKDE